MTTRIAAKKAESARLVADYLYDPDMENLLWGSLVEDYSLLDSKHTMLIKDLQEVHDVYTVIEMEGTVQL